MTKELELFLKGFDFIEHNPFIDENKLINGLKKGNNGKLNKTALAKWKKYYQSFKEKFYTFIQSDYTNIFPAITEIENNLFTLETSKHKAYLLKVINAIYSFAFPYFDIDLIYPQIQFRTYGGTAKDVINILQSICKGEAKETDYNSFLFNFWTSYRGLLFHIHAVCYRHNISFIRLQIESEQIFRLPHYGDGASLMDLGVPLKYTSEENRQLQSFIDGKIKQKEDILKGDNQTTIQNRYIIKVDNTLSVPAIALAHYYSNNQITGKNAAQIVNDNKYRTKQNAPVSSTNFYREFKAVVKLLNEAKEYKKDNPDLLIKHSKYKTLLTYIDKIKPLLTDLKKLDQDLKILTS